MNISTDDLQLLRTLILKSQSETLTEQEIEDLNRLVQTDQGAEEAASLIDQLCAFSDSGSLDAIPMTDMLTDALGPQLRCEVDGDVLPDQTENQWLRPSWLIVLAASYLLVASLAWSLASVTQDQGPETNKLTRLDPPSYEDSRAGSFTASPQLVSMTACVWRSEDEEEAPTLGQSIQSGEVLSLLEGIADLQIGQGTRNEALVRIEGPASIFVRSDGQLGLRHGCLTAKSLGTGFRTVTIDTPIGEVLIDGQSSIGLVSEGPVNEVHLFSGSAQVYPHPFTSAPTEIGLEAGEAVRYTSKPDDDIDVILFEASMSSFASARSSGFDPLKLGDDYAQVVLEAKPNIYWRFQELEGDSEQYIKNLGSDEGMHATVVGDPTWRQYGENRVAELGTSAISSAFRALEPWPQKPLDEYSVELWLKPQLYHHGEVICMHAIDPVEDGRYPHTMMLETIAQHFFTHRLKNFEPNRIRFVHRQLRSNEPIDATTMLSEEQYQSRVWQHIVVQRKDGQQMLWIDGQLSAKRPNPVPLSNGVQILVGQVYPTPAYRRFVGQIDEIAIYDRAIKPQEMREHIKAAGRRVENKKNGRQQ